jgi:hypothetical protein
LTLEKSNSKDFIMTILYKLTDQNMKTRPGEYNETLWGENVTHSGTGEGELCGPGYIHAYLSPELALLLNPIHANYQNPILWECEGDIAINDKNLKVGCITLTTKKIIEQPKISSNIQVHFAILCVLEVYENSDFIKWADNWIKNIDRTSASADAARADAAYAAYSAAYAADAARADAAYAARAAAYAAADAARAAADAAADAARAAAYVTLLDLQSLAKKAFDFEKDI